MEWSLGTINIYILNVTLIDSGHYEILISCPQKHPGAEAEGETGLSSMDRSLIIWSTGHLYLAGE